jgi:uncharacterized protein with ATP-grasp and redox domains
MFTIIRRIKTMKMDARCTYCLLSRVHYEAKLSTNDDTLIHKTMLAGIDVLKDTYVPGVPAGVVSTAIHRKAYEVLNDDDPYLDLKILSNEIAEKVYPYAHSLVHEGEPSDLEMFRRAVLASVIGNFFDFGIMGFDVGEDVVLDIIRKVGGKITLVVRGAPMLTDVTMDDVRKYELDKKVDRVLTTGCNAVGVSFDEAPPEFIEALENASLIISKGMANYETMSERSFGPIAYLLRTKCEAVAEDMGLEMGYSVAQLVR